MIELQITDEKLYNELKQYANYNSDLTRVCAFRDELSELINSFGIEVSCEKKEVTNKKPILTITGRNVMKLDGASPEMLHFVGVRSEYDPTISIRFMDEVNKLITNNLVDVDEKFKKIYSKLSYRSKISDLISAHVVFKGKGNLLDHVDGALTIQSLKFNEVVETKINYKLFKLKVKSALGDGRTGDIECQIINSTKSIILKFYNKPQILKSIAFQGNEISISAAKVSEDKQGNYVVYDPIILPKGLEMTENIMFSPKGRKIPIDFYRNAYYEFMCRYNQ